MVNTSSQPQEFLVSYVHDGYLYSDECDYDGEKEQYDLKTALPLLNIGQMIEFLGDGDYLFEDDRGNLVMPVSPDEYLDLCDELWQSVKKVLQTKASA